MKARRLLVLLAALALASVTAAAAPKKLLVVTQSKGFQHGPVKRPMPDQPCLVEQQLKELGEKSGVFTADFSQDAIAVLTKENLAKYDAVFFYTTGSLLPAGEPREALLDFVKSGKGFIGTHSSTDTFHDFKGYTALINGRFAGHPWGSGTQCSFVNHEPEHPVVKMLGGDFQWKDEIYQYNDYDPKAVRVLYSLDMAKTNPKRPYLVPVCWVREYGTGRLFYTNLGHNEATWKDAKFHEHLLAGIKWATKLIDGPATPNPEVQQVEHNKAVLAYAASLEGKSIIGSSKMDVDALLKDWSAKKSDRSTSNRPIYYHSRDVSVIVYYRNDKADGVSVMDRPGAGVNSISQNRFDELVKLIGQKPMPNDIKRDTTGIHEFHIGKAE